MDALDLLGIFSLYKPQPLIIFGVNQQAIHGSIYICEGGKQAVGEIGGEAGGVNGQGGMSFKKFNSCLIVGFRSELC